ncbi:MAG: thioredoxin domain-containing protein [Candidatus Omnitrophota bacterium]|jgi:cytochrome c biogenesis protein CcdA
MKIKKTLITGVILVMLLGIYAFAKAESAPRRLIVFFSPQCHACAQAKEKVIPQIAKQYAGRVEIEYRDITNVDNYKFLLSLKAARKDTGPIGIPLFYFEGNFLLGLNSAENLHKIIDASLSKPRAPLPESIVDLYEHFKSFRPLVIFSAALIDGINPCAFTVIVFFMSFLALQGYRKRVLIAVGLTFIFTVFLTYLLLGIGIFQFLYRLQGFFLISKIVNLAIGVFSVVLGFFAVYDFYKFKKTGQSEGLTLQLPKAVKNQIHSLIGTHYRRSAQEKAEGKQSNITGLIVSAFITGFLVSLLEAVCTGQTYLPTIVFILKAYKSFKAFVYLLAYNLLFITPLAIIFLCAVLGATSKDFSEFMKKHLGLIKILMAILFFSLGVFLIWRS